MDDQVYGRDREQSLVELLRAIAAMIQQLEDDRALLAAGPELLKMMGDARSELFHYEVRITYDLPEIAESRRIVDEAKRRRDALKMENEDLDLDDRDDDQPWRGGKE
jgi:hypothetical protein